MKDTLKTNGLDVKIDTFLIYQFGGLLYCNYD